MFNVHQGQCQSNRSRYVFSKVSRLSRLDTKKTYIQVPIDMRCIPPNLLQKLASQFTHKELCHVVDPKDKLESRLYQFKVVELLKKSESELARCKNCSKVFAKRFIGRLRCERVEPKLDVVGRIQAHHQL